MPLPLEEDNHEDEKMEEPNALERPPDGRVSDSERKRLLVGIEDVTEAECRRFGRAGARLAAGGIWRCERSASDSAEPGRLVRVLEAAAKR